MKESKNNLSDAPQTNTAKAIKMWLVDHGACGIMSLNAASTIIGVSKRVIKDAERRGDLVAIDKCTYNLDSLVTWLVHYPRYIAQK